MKIFTFIFILTTIFLFWDISVSASIFLEQQNEYIPAISDATSDDAQCYLSTFEDENLPLEERIKAAEKLISNYTDNGYKEKIKPAIFDIIENNQNTLLRNEVDPLNEKYFPAEGYESLMLILEEFKDRKTIPFLLKLTDKIKGFEKYDLVCSSEYVLWALKQITLANRNEIENIDEIINVLDSVYKEACDNQVANWANSTILEMSKADIEEAKIDKNRQLFFYRLPASDSDKEILKDIDEKVSASNLMETIKDFQSFTTRAPGTLGHQKAVEYITGFLENLGFSIEEQNFKSYGQNHKNIITQIEGITKLDEKIVICAHYDSITVDTIGENSPAPGANDNATGISTLLEIAKILKESNIKFNSTIEFVFLDAEETGKRGSNYYVRQALLNDEYIRGVLNVDSIGWDEDGKLELVSNNASRDLLDALAGISGEYLPQQEVETSIMEVGSGDENNFWKAGRRGGYNAVLMTGDMDNPDPRLNTSRDTWRHLDPDFLENSAKFAITAVTALANPLDPIQILVNDFVDYAKNKGVWIAGENNLKYKFDYGTVKDIFSAFKLIPEQHLEVLNTILFEEPEVHAAIFSTDEGKITVSTAHPDLAAKAVVHETGHLNFHSLKEKISDMNFEGDYDFLCKYYYGHSRIPEESISPEGLIDETFAVMYHMYILESEELKNWIEKRTEIGDRLALNNYNFMKNVVFSGKEY